MLKKIVWYSIIAIAVAGFVTLSTGFYQALNVTSGSKTTLAGNIEKIETTLAETSTARKDPNSIRIVIMGDSIAKGTGDEKGKGFSTYLPDYFKNQTPKEITVDNIGIDGLQSEVLLEQLQSRKVSSLVADSNFLVISIGGNDVRGLQSNNDIAKDDEFKNKQEKYLDNLKEALKILRKNSSNAYIIFVGLYNPYENKSSYDNTRFVNTWNYNTQQLVEEDGRAVFIPTYDLFKFNLNRYIAADGLHPNSAGYQAVSSRITKSVENILNKGQ